MIKEHLVNISLVAFYTPIHTRYKSSVLPEKFFLEQEVKCELFGFLAVVTNLLYAQVCARESA